MKSSALLRPALGAAALLTLALFSTLWFAAADAADSQSVSGIVADIEDDLADDLSSDFDDDDKDVDEDDDLDDRGEEPPLLEEEGEEDASTVPDQMRALFARADAGDAEAQNLIGVCYFYGKRVEKNIGEAVRWFSRSAVLG
ncbi:MAG: SEL1-like repeat protein, partial [Thermoguttaceae bacterium]|nr:SEL1-like repeat protein [Thermoguttaceae bacterium]